MTTATKDFGLETTIFATRNFGLETLYLQGAFRGEWETAALTGMAPAPVRGDHIVNVTEQYRQSYDGSGWVNIAPVDTDTASQTTAFAPTETGGIDWLNAQSFGAAVVREECFVRSTNTCYDGGVDAYTNGAGCYVAAATPPGGAEGRPGILRFHTANVGNGRAVLASDSAFAWTFDASVTRTIFETSVLFLDDGSGEARHFIYRAGWGDDEAGTGTDYLAFRYRYFDSDEWYVTCDTAGGGTSLDVATGVTAEVDTWYKLSIVITPTGTPDEPIVDFYVDSECVYTWAVTAGDLPSSSGLLPCQLFRDVDDQGAADAMMDYYMYGLDSTARGPA